MLFFVVGLSTALTNERNDVPVVQHLSDFHVHYFATAHHCLLIMMIDDSIHLDNASFILISDHAYLNNVYHMLHVHHHDR